MNFLKSKKKIFLLLLRLSIEENKSYMDRFYFVFIYLGVLRRFQHCTGHITTGSWKGRGNQYIQFVRVLYCNLPTNSKQLPAFPLEAVPGTEPRPQRWEVRVLPLCHHGPPYMDRIHIKSFNLKEQTNKTFNICLST